MKRIVVAFFLSLLLGQPSVTGAQAVPVESIVSGLQACSPLAGTLSDTVPGPTEVARLTWIFPSGERGRTTPGLHQATLMPNRLELIGNAEAHVHPTRADLALVFPRTMILQPGADVNEALRRSFEQGVIVGCFFSIRP
jgi:hypothetical protein